MIRNAVFLFLMSIVWTSCSPSTQVDMSSEQEAIESVMRAQEVAWNEGDLRGFMEGYANSDSTLFVGKTRVNYGWQKVLDSYIKGYPNMAAMGHLQFDLIRIVPIDETHAYVVGKWTLTENDKPASGHFVLIFEKLEGAWRIVVDGTS